MLDWGSCVNHDDMAALASEPACTASTIIRSLGSAAGCSGRARHADQRNKFPLIRRSRPSQPHHNMDLTDLITSGDSHGIANIGARNFGKRVQSLDKEVMIG
jgi:hypothetical protein